MPSQRRELSLAQKESLAKIRDIRDRRATARVETERRIRQAMKDELAELDLEYALEIRRARELEVAIKTIGVEGMGTQDRNTVHRWLKRTDRIDTSLIAPETLAGQFFWRDKEAGIADVSIKGFATTIVADDYPETLVGTVRRDSEAPNGWAVVEDPGTITTQLGSMRGWFSVEILDVPFDTIGSLTSMLTRWAGQS